jgi:N-acetylmuramic acid 6-phosphate etherase
MSASDQAQAFLKIAGQFKLGHLATESFHPLTSDLSQVVKKDLASALKILQQVDAEAIRKMHLKSEAIWELSQDIRNTLSAGHKVFMCGCGATGRLSLVLETLYHQKFGKTDKVISFMAGGDFALIKSVESFEDNVAYGERQLLELGFGENDLLLSPTEGGETPFVIGATNLAARVSKRSPYFLYCNPDELLMPIMRSREVIENSKIKKLNLTVGPMAISGSTRMQASTVLMLAIGMGLLYQFSDRSEFHSFYSEFLEELLKTDYSSLKEFTALEAKLYQDKKFINYIGHPSLAISILTDTTERSPTFSLRGFENRLDPIESRSLSYLFIPETKNAQEAWEKLLNRKPRPLNWVELEGKIDESKVYGFDISISGKQDRENALSTEDFNIDYENGITTFKFCDLKQTFNWGSDLLFNHLMVKMLLNAHSTLIMGLLGRYEGNVMTWVRSSNNKLIDRSARYILQILSQRGKTATYEDVVLKIFEESENLEENDPIVLKVLRRF